MIGVGAVHVHLTGAGGDGDTAHQQGPSTGQEQRVPPKTKPTASTTTGDLMIGLVEAMQARDDRLINLAELTQLAGVKPQTMWAYRSGRRDRTQQHPVPAPDAELLGSPLWWLKGTARPWVKAREAARR
ncbi:MAG: hypothetical protein ACRCZP_11605 [Phycicoccus sp.]